jgi:hypothetical protein
MIKFHFYRGWKAAPTGQKDNRFKAAKFLALIRRAALSPEAIAYMKLN